MSSDAIAQSQSVPAAGLEVWKSHLAALAAVLLAVGLLFHDDIAAALSVWWIFPAYSHCYLIIPISAWLIWEKRAALLSDTPAAEPRALIAIIPFLLLWLLGRFGSITEFRQFAIVGMAEVAIFAVLGRHIFARISFACLYLFFLVPTGQYLIAPLQEITAKFVEVGLNLFSVPHYREGLMFDLVNGRYEIAEACAGLRFLVATVALGALFAHMTFRKPLKIVLFMVSCFIIPVIGNGIRALLTVMVANYTDNRVAAGFDHIVYGWVFAVCIIFLVMYIGSRFRDREVDMPDAPGRLRPLHRGLLLATALGAVAVVSIGPAAAFLSERRPSGASQAALNDALAVPNWRARPISSDWNLNFDHAALATSAALARGDIAAPVDVDIRYYIRKQGTPSLLSERNHPWNGDWHPVSQARVHQAVSGTDVPFDEAVVSGFSEKRLVWSTYWVDGRFTTSSLPLRLMEFQSGIVHGHSAVLGFSTPITSTEEDARQRLRALLASFPGLSVSLAKAGDLPAPMR